MTRSIVAIAATALLAAPMFAQSAKTDAAAQPAQESPIAGTDLARMLRRDTQNLLLRKTVRGEMQIDVDGGFRSVLIAQIGPDGKARISCIASEREAEKLFAPRKEAPREKP